MSSSPHPSGPTGQPNLPTGPSSQVNTSHLTAQTTQGNVSHQLAQGAAQPPNASHPASQANTQTPHPTNYISLCRYGQDTVQDIVQKTNEMFQLLKTMQLPNETTMMTQTFTDRKTKLEEHSKMVVSKFKTLHVIYDKVNEYTATLDPAAEVTQSTEAQQVATEEHQEIVEQVKSKNAQLKEIIDHLRTVIWEINTMIAMRKTVIT